MKYGFKNTERETKAKQLNVLSLSCTLHGMNDYTPSYKN